MTSMTPTEYEFRRDSRIFRTYLIDGKWKVSMTDNDRFYDRMQSYVFLVDADGTHKWDEMPEWRKLMPNPDDLEVEDSEANNVSWTEAEFDTPEEAQEAVVWWWLREDRRQRDEEF